MPSKPVFEDTVEVSLDPMTWADVCAALQDYIRGEAQSRPKSQASAIAALQEIDRVMRGAEEPSPPDDLLGGPA